MLNIYHTKFTTVHIFLLNIFYLKISNYQLQNLKYKNANLNAILPTNVEQIVKIKFPQIGTMI